MSIKPFASRQAVTMFLASAEKARTPTGLKKALSMVEYRIGEAQKMGWPALAESWQQDAESIKQMLGARGVRG